MPTQIRLSDEPESQLVSHIKSIDQWICWRYSGGNKPPADPRTGRFVDATDESNWLSYQEALEYNLRSGGVNGIGFCLSRQDGVVLVDVDDCLTSSLHVEDWTRSIMDNLDSYTERSPGGSGIHILVKADINTYGKSSDEDLEIYDANKYFTFTGEHIHGYPVDIRSRDRQVRALIRNYGPFVY